MSHLFDLIFQLPPLPPIELPLPARLVPGVRTTIAKAFELAYYRGVYDGLVAGALVTLLFVPSLRGRIAKGASHVAEHLYEPKAALFGPHQGVRPVATEGHVTRRNPPDHQEHHPKDWIPSAT